jgi:beta-galactosidase
MGFDDIMLRHAQIPGTGVNVTADMPGNMKYRCILNPRTALPDSLVSDNRPILTRPMEYNLWRAPIDNDIQAKKQWCKAGYDRPTVKVYETSRTGNRISSRLSIGAIQVQHILDVESVWTLGENALQLEITAKRDTALPYLPRFGLRLFLPTEYSRFEYLGFGPYESYIDKHRASWFGWFVSDVDSEYVDYIKPQEHGSHWGTEELVVYDAGAADAAYAATVGSGSAADNASGHPKGDTSRRLRIRAGAPFSFNISRYTQEELGSKAHNYELQDSGAVVLCLDYKMSGVGSGSCGPQLAEKYQLKDGEILFKLVFEV